jgi:DNA-binding MarR family transcriptional regulator
MPDVTRLLDRMEEAGLVVRSRDNDDRRLVSTRITAVGRRLVDELDAPVGEHNRRRIGHLTGKQLSDLVELLTLARNSE